VMISCSSASNLSSQAVALNHKVDFLTEKVDRFKAETESSFRSVADYLARIDSEAAEKYATQKQTISANRKKSKSR
jgi:hypothetical protein